MKKPLFPLIIIGTVIMIVVMVKTEAPLKTPATPAGIINLELAFDTAHSNKTIAAWTSVNAIGAAKINTYWDFLFIFFYSLFLFLCCKKLSAKFNPGTWKRKAALFFSKAILVAALLDMAENSGMLLTLNGSGASSVILITSLCSAVKWVLVLLTVLYVLLALFLKRQVP